MKERNYKNYKIWREQKLICLDQVTTKLFRSNQPAKGKFKWTSFWAIFNLIRSHSKLKSVTTIATSKWFFTIFNQDSWFRSPLSFTEVGWTAEITRLLINVLDELAKSKFSKFKG